jgi:hypothetical protein
MYTVGPSKIQGLGRPPCQPSHNVCLQWWVMLVLDDACVTGTVGTGPCSLNLKVKTDLDVYIYLCLHKYVIWSHRRKNALLLIDRKGNQVDAYKHV